MAANTNQLIGNFASDLNAFAAQYAKLSELVMRLDTIYNGSGVQAAIQGMANGDTVGDTQATKAMLLNAVTRATEVKAAIGNGNIAKLQTLLAFTEAMKASSAA